MDETKIGIVEAISYPNQALFGEQHTTIDGTKYFTWWDWKDGVRIGKQVEYLPYKGTMNFNGHPFHYDGAKIIKVL